jgi:hypothetical protein
MAERGKQKAEAAVALGQWARGWRSGEIVEMREKRDSFVHALLWGRIAPWGEGQTWKGLMEREL